MIDCQNCRDYGYTYYGPSGARKINCSTCKGKGKVAEHQRCKTCKGMGGLYDRVLRMHRTCGGCFGTGFYDVQPEVPPLDIMTPKEYEDKNNRQTP